MTVKLLWILTLCLAVHSGFIIQFKSTGQGTRRNLADYNKAGPYEFDNDLHPRDADKILGEMRGFLWKHWKERRLGLVTATFYTIEGDPTKSRYFVETDARGHWRIRVDSESTISALLPKGKRPRHEITRNDYNEVDRIEGKSANAATQIVVTEQEVREPQTFKLRLRNSKTNSVRIF